MVYQEPDVEKLKVLYTDLEFKNLLTKLDPVETKNSSKQAAVQLSLFEEYVDESTGKIKYSNLSDLTSTPHTYQLIDNEELIVEFLAKLSEQEFFCFDTETTGTNVISDDLVGFSFSWKEFEAFYVPVPKDRGEAEKFVHRFKSIFENESVMKIGQNIKFDLLMLRQYGVQLKGKMFDTMIAHYLLQPDLRHGMDYLAEVYSCCNPIPLQVQDTMT